ASKEARPSRRSHTGQMGNFGERQWGNSVSAVTGDRPRCSHPGRWLDPALRHARLGTELLFQLLTEREEKNSVAFAIGYQMEAFSQPTIFHAAESDGISVIAESACAPVELVS
ncbi:hypothetical protein AB0M12_12325, partial [Nocardia vinacea]